MIKSPRQKFLASKVRGEWEKITETAAFEQACDYALLQLTADSPVTESEPKASMAYQQIIGAWAVIKILKNIHEQEKEQTASEIPTKLNYQAGV